MPRAPASPFGTVRQQVSEWDLLMAAATMHEQGRLVEKETAAEEAAEIEEEGDDR